MMKRDMINRELLLYYFSGGLDDYLDYLDKLNNPINGYRMDTIRFIHDVKNQHDPFKKKLTPELLDMYVQHYKEHVWQWASFTMPRLKPLRHATRNLTA